MQRIRRIGLIGAIFQVSRHALGWSRTLAGARGWYRAARGAARGPVVVTTRFRSNVPW